MPTKPQLHRPAHYQSYDAGRRKQDARLAAAKKFRDSAAWQKLRGLVKRVFPWCCDPFGDHRQSGRLGQSDIGHHIEGLVERPDLALVFTNVAPLCTGCNAKVEMMVRQGQATQHLFRQHQERARQEAIRIGIDAEDETS